MSKDSLTIFKDGEDTNYIIEGVLMVFTAKDITGANWPTIKESLIRNAIDLYKRDITRVERLNKHE